MKMCHRYGSWFKFIKVPKRNALNGNLLAVKNIESELVNLEPYILLHNHVCICGSDYCIEFKTCHDIYLYSDFCQ